MKGGKIAAISVVGILLVVAVVVAVVVSVKKNKSDGGPTANTSNKMILSICEGTTYKEACVRSMESAGKNNSATAKDYIMAAVSATKDEVKKSLEASNKVSVNKDADQYNYMAVEDCKIFLDDAVDMLNITLASVLESDNKGLEERAHELLSWVTAVHAMHTTCLDQILSPETKSALQKGMVNSTEMAHNVVNIVAGLPEVLQLFGIALSGNANSPSQSQSGRRLLNEDGSPTWLSAADRKLLGANNNGKDDSIPYIRNINNIRPNVVVAKDGSGQFKTINQALAAYPAKLSGRFIIYVKAGVYAEKVIIDKKKPNIFMYGDGMGKTIVTGRLNGANKVPTTDTASFANEAFGFIARGMTFRNEAGPQGHQAVAFRNKGDKVAIFDCSFEGNQDTLYYQFLRQFYRNCDIYGTIDFIFGKGDAVIQNCNIIVRRPMATQFNTVTADGKEIPRGSNGLVIQNCIIRPDNFLWGSRFQVATYLGRPWSPTALTVFMQSEIGDFIRPEGYMKWEAPEGKNNHKTCNMYEFGNRGPGAKTDKRNYREFTSSRVIGQAEAARYTPGQFIAGNAWLPQTGFPFALGFI